MPLLQLQVFLSHRFFKSIWLRNHHDIYLLLQTHLSFYVYGNSNSIANLDLVNSYIGLDQFSFEWCGLLTFIANWVGPLLVVLTDLVLRFRLSSGSFVEQLVVFTAWRSWSLTIISLSVIILRHHLFIWSVFSPRYLYEIAWICGFHFCTTVLWTVSVFVSKSNRNTS